MSTVRVAKLERLLQRIEQNAARPRVASTSEAGVDELCDDELLDDAFCAPPPKPGAAHGLGEPREPERLVALGGFPPGGGLDDIEELGELAALSELPSLDDSSELDALETLSERETADAEAVASVAALDAPDALGLFDEPLATGSAAADAADARRTEPALENALENATTDEPEEEPPARTSGVAPAPADPEVEIGEDEYVDSDDLFDEAGDLLELVEEEAASPAGPSWRAPPAAAALETEFTPASPAVARAVSTLPAPTAPEPELHALDAFEALRRFDDEHPLTPPPESGREPMTDEERATLARLRESQGPTLEQLGETLDLPEPTNAPLELETFPDEPPSGPQAALHLPPEETCPEPTQSSRELTPVASAELAWANPPEAAPLVPLTLRRTPPAPDEEPATFEPREPVAVRSFLALLEQTLALRLR